MKAGRRKAGCLGANAGAKSHRDPTGRSAIAKYERQLELLRKRNRDLSSALTAIKRSQPETIQRERLQALGQMASGIVHDFNNALTPILGASDFLLMNPKMLDRREQAILLLETIRTSAHDAKNMVSRLREFSHPKEDEEA